MTPLAARAETPSGAGRLEMVDRPRRQLDRERDRSAFGELVAVEAQGQARIAAGGEVAARLGRVEGAPLEEDVGGVREPGGLREHLGEREREVRVGVRELRRNRVRAEPGRRPARRPHRRQRGELGVAVEPVARLALPGRRAVPEQTAGVRGDALAQRFRAERPRRLDGGEDAAAGGVQLLVSRTRGTERELLDAVAPECRVGVAVDEPGDRAEPGAVELLELALLGPAVERPQVAHRADRLDRRTVADHVGVLDHVDPTERLSPQRPATPRGRRDLRQVPQQEAARRRSPAARPWVARRDVPGRHAAQASPIGVVSPCSRAASLASG